MLAGLPSNAQCVPALACCNHLRATRSHASVCPWGASGTSLPASAPAQAQPCFPTFTRDRPPLSQIGSLVDRSQAFGLSKTEVSKILEYGAFDGILGLSYPNLALTGTTPVFDNLWAQGAISQKLFAFYLSR